jgi:hypothetical protein
VKRLATTVLAALALGLAAEPAARAAEPGLTGQWHLDAIDGSGAASTTPDASGAGQPGTFTGTPTLVAGRFGSALNVGAGNGWMNVPRPSGGTWALESQHISFTVWIKQAGFPGALRYIAGKGALGPYPTCGGSSWGMYTGYNAKPGLAFYVKDSIGGGVLSPQLGPSASVWDGLWHAVTGTYDGVAVRLYVDGAQVGSGTPFTAPIDYADAAQDNFTLGTYPDRIVGAPCGIADWPGAIDEPRVHDRALTQAEITKLHDPAATTPPDLTPPTTEPPPTTTTTRPPFDIFELPARNLVPPEIQSKPYGAGKRVYSCTNGEWEGLADDPKFARRIYSRELGVVSGKRAPDKFVTAASGVVLGNTSPRKVYYCVVKAAARSGGTVSATGPLHVVPDVLIRGPISINPKIIGDLRIRGIDVFQLVQPTSGAAQYAFDGFPQPDLAFATVCGGGTPVSLVAPACAANGAATQQARYNGVLLDADKPTSAVVYLDRKPDGLTAHSDAQLQVKLRMTAGARVNASLTQTTSTVNLFSSTSDAVTAAERGDERYGVRFEIPQDWIGAAANGEFGLQATVTTVGASDTQQCKQSPITILTTPDAGCTANDTYKLTEVYARFLPFSGIFRSIGLFDKSSQTLASLRSPQSALASAQTVLPGGEHFQISPYVAGLPIDPATATNAKNCPAPAGSEAADAMRARLRDCASANVYNAVRAWVASGPATDVNASPTDGFHVLLALHNYQYTPGWTEPGSSFNTNGVGYWGRTSNQPYLQLNDGTVNRPLTSATHELVHALGAQHAGKSLSGIGGDPSCGGDKNGQVGEPWPPDNAGRLQGVMFDPATGNRTLDSDDTVTNTSQPLWDLMSYCTGDPTAWISPRNWNRAFAFMVQAESVVPTTFQVPIRRPRAVAAQAPANGLVPTVPGAGFVVGVVVGDQARITGLEPADPDHVVPAGDAGSSLRVRGIGANGQTLADVGARVSSDSETGATTFIAPVPSGSSAVELVSGGTVVDRREKGRAPSVTLLAPRRKGTRVRKSLEVRYRVSDPDGGDLTASVEFSRDGRTKWRTVQRGPATGRAVLPAELLHTATAGRVRVKVTDGFSTAEVTSVALRVDGRPPAATIVRPARGEDATAAATVVLLGQGADETGKRLRGRALTWYAGAKRLGFGERLKARLPAGRTTVRLVVRDGNGRETTARRALRVDPVALELRTLRASAAKTGARRVTVTVATNVAATLRGGGVSVRVGPKARTLRLALPAKPATGLLRLSLRLTPAGGGTALRPVLVVLRG